MNVNIPSKTTTKNECLEIKFSSLGKKETQIKTAQHVLILKHHPDLNIFWWYLYIIKTKIQLRIMDAGKELISQH